MPQYERGEHMNVGQFLARKESFIEDLPLKAQTLPVPDRPFLPHYSPDRSFQPRQGSPLRAKPLATDIPFGEHLT